MEEATTSMLRSKTNKDKNHFDFLSSLKQKPCILDYNVEDQPHQRNITHLMSYVLAAFTSNSNMKHWDPDKPEGLFSNLLWGPHAQLIS
jgi:hypothetical protein